MPRQRRRTLTSALAERPNRLPDPSLTSFRRLGGLDRDDDPLLITEGQPLEESLHRRLALERAREIGRQRDLSRGRIELHVDTHLVAGGYARGVADFRADREHEAPAHRGHGAAIRVALDRDADRWFLARSQFGDDRGRHLEAGRGLTCQFDDGAKFHRFALVVLATGAETVSGCEKRMWLPKGSRRPQSIPYGRSVGFSVNSTPFARSSL